MPDKRVILTARIAGGFLGDLLPYELVLEEGFSCIYHARLLMLSTQSHTGEALAEILDKGISLTVSQVLRDGSTQRKRYLHGIVTDIAANGVFYSSDKNCYSYTLIIEGELARLRLNRRNGAYYRQSPVDAIEAVLAKNGISAQFPTAYINRNVYKSRSLMFDQNEQSDFDFITNLLSLYGLSFMYIHPASQGDAVASPELVFSKGDSFPAPGLYYSDERNRVSIDQFDFVGTDEAGSIWKMDTFHMGSSIGIDGIELSASYPEYNYGNAAWKKGETGPGKRCISYNRQFHGYERGTSREDIDADIEIILASRFRAFELAKKDWGGKAANLLLIPGSIFELSRFYGRNDSFRIKALVTATKLHVREVWPETLAIRPDVPEVEEIIEVDFACMNYADGADRRFCRLQGEENYAHGN